MALPKLGIKTQSGHGRIRKGSGYKMKTKIIFTGSVWHNYYVEVNLSGLRDDIAEQMMDSFVIDSCLNTIIINKELTPDDVVKLIDFLKEKEVWNNVARLVVNEE